MDYISYPVEIIPDEDDVFRNIHRNLYLNVTIGKTNSNNFIPPQVFHDNNGISVNWKKYCSASASKSRAKDSMNTGVISCNVGDIRYIDPLEVLHEPSMQNRAHSGIQALSKSPIISKTKIRLLLSRIAKWEIRF